MCWSFKLWDKVPQFSALIGENILKIRIDSKIRILTKLLFGFLLFFLKKRLLIAFPRIRVQCTIFPALSAKKYFGKKDRILFLEKARQRNQFN